jgi:hypothetical protein
MKLFCLLSFLIVSAMATAQSASGPSPIEIRVFQPLSLPGQQRPVKPPPPPLLSQKNMYYLVLILSLVAILGSAIFVCGRVPGLMTRVVIIIGALLLSGLVAFGLLFAIGITATPDDSKQGIVRRDMLRMGDHLGMSIESVAAVVEDDECRVGMLIGERALVVADFGENRGLLVPFAQLDSVASHQGPANALPPLPAPVPDRWVIETDAARQSGDTTPLQQIEWHFRQSNPSVIVLRYATPDYFFPEVSSIAALCRQRQQEAH